MFISFDLLSKPSSVLEPQNPSHFESTTSRRSQTVHARIRLRDLLIPAEIICLFTDSQSALGIPLPNLEPVPSSPQPLSTMLEENQATATADSSHSAANTTTPPAHHTNIVSWAFSGTYEPSRPIFLDALDPQRSISKEAALDLVARLAGSFTPGSTVCLHLDNDILYPILCFAIYASKCRWSGINTSYKVPELAHLFQASDAKYVITTAGHLDTVKSAVVASGMDAEIILFTDILDGQQSARPSCSRKFNPGHKSEDFRVLHDLLDEDGTPDKLVAMLKDIDPSSIATLMSTSGTTGKPKMAARSHAATVLETAATAGNEHEQKPFEVRRLFCTPIFHAFTMPEMVINCLRLGHPAYFMKRFDDNIFPAKIAELKITETLAPPGVLLRLVNNAASHSQIQSLRTIFTGGAPLAPELRSQFRNLYPGTKPRIVPVWGMTEGGWFTTLKFPEDDSTGSVGRPIPGYEIKLSEEKPVKLSSGAESAELLIRGPQLMSGYLNNPEANRETFTEDGWLRTGDIGYIADDGKVYLCDRKKDLIKCNGWQVSPSELEDALLISPDVKDAGVIGSGDHVHEHPLAFVVRSDGSPDVTAKTLKEHMLKYLAGYKCRSCEFQFIDTIPRSATGKILKNELKAMAVL